MIGFLSLKYMSYTHCYMAPLVQIIHQLTHRFGIVLQINKIGTHTIRILGYK